MWRLLFAALAIVVATPGVAMAAEGGFWKGVGWSAANFVILGGVLFVVLRKRVRAALENRRNAILAELGEAARVREEAAARASEVEAKIESLDAEVARLVEEFRAEGAREQERLVVEAARQAERIRAEAEVAMAQELLREKRRLRDEVVAGALAAAEETLRREVGDADRERISREYVERFRAAIGEQAHRDAPQGGGQP